jgi:hypothetical protein
MSGFAANAPVGAVRTGRGRADHAVVSTSGIGADALLTTMALQATDVWGTAMLGKALDTAGASTLALLMSMPAASPPGRGGTVDVQA